MIDKKSRIFFAVFFAILAWSVYASYYNFVVMKNFVWFENEDDIPSQLEIIGN